MASSHPPDCPWDARLLLDEQQEQKKKETKKVRDSGNELKKKQERCEYLIRAVPVSMEATVGVNVDEDEKSKLRRMGSGDRGASGTQTPVLSAPVSPISYPESPSSLASRWSPGETVENSKKIKFFDWLAESVLSTNRWPKGMRTLGTRL